MSNKSCIVLALMGFWLVIVGVVGIVQKATGTPEAITITALPFDHVSELSRGAIEAPEIEIDPNILFDETITFDSITFPYNYGIISRGDNGTVIFRGDVKKSLLALYNQFTGENATCILINPPEVKAETE